MHNKDTSLQMFGLKTLLVCVFAVFVLRLIELQLIQGSAFRQRADENRFFTRYLPASRGIISDRNGRPMVQNIPEYKRATVETANQPFPKLEPISADEAQQLLANEDKNVFIDEQRTYLFGPALSQVLGYTGEVTEEELQAHQEYSLGENVGKYGFEKIHQRELSGKKGSQVYEMQANGKLLRKVLEENPVAGTDLRLGVDASLSAKAYELLAGRKGAVVVSDIATGELLVLVSSPSFDPEHLADALKNPDSPMLDRAIAGTYPPGSTFKMMTGLAGLRNGAVKSDTEFEDTGEIKIGEALFGNWFYREYGRKEGMVSFVKAIQRSNDIYFYNVAGLVGPDEIAQVARAFHYGQPTGVELTGEAAGRIPTPEWKQRALGQPWYLGDTYHMGIGQGDVLVTPLQVNQVTAAIAAGGKWCVPHLVFGTKPNCVDVDVKAEDLALVKEGMIAVCATGGTAFPFFDKQPVEVACKTGTAEFGSANEKGHRKTHALFTAMAPADHPKYAITVLVEGTEDHPFLEGSSDAAPIAKELLKAMF